jgi:hypothetical protein
VVGGEGPHPDRGRESREPRLADRIAGGGGLARAPCARRSRHPNATESVGGPKGCVKELPP